MFQKVNPQQNFPALEDEINNFWKKNNIFKKQVESRPENDKYVFYDGPPFITGLPHYGHLLGSISKDIIPRFFAMKGKRVERVWGWDCHGLPIENKVEKALELKNRRDIEKLGIGNFVNECYKYTRSVSEEWNWYIDKIGRWVDMDRAYRTMDQNYMESVMWIFKQLYSKDLIYEGVRTSLFCPRCGTPVSNFEIAMDNSYTDMEDPGITVKFKLTPCPLSHGRRESHSLTAVAWQAGKSLKINPESKIPVYMLAWTTTPWTIPSNRGLVVENEGEYLQIRRKISVNRRKGAKAFIYNPKKNEFLFVRWNVDRPLKINSLIGGGLEDNETSTDAVQREILEETGFVDLKVVGKLGTNVHQQYVGLNEICTKEEDIFLIELTSGKTTKISSEDKNQYELVWVGLENLIEDLTYTSHKEFAKLVENYYKTGVLETKDISEEPISKNDFIEDIIVGKGRVKEVLKDVEYEVIQKLKGKDLVGLTYEALYDFFPPNEKDFKVYAYEGMVSAEEGVGIVHSAPGFGEIDTEMGKEVGLTIMMSIDDEGKFISTAGKFAGMFYKNANRYIVEDLKKRNFLFDYEPITHRYPFCYRCETPLIQKAQSSWYVDIQKIKNKLVKNNEKINWVPEHIKEGRFKIGLEQAPDWGISRSRYWGTPMPIWETKDADGKVIERQIIESRDELMARNDNITKIIFVRHGDVDKEKDIDPSLNESGKKQAEEIFEKLKDEKIDFVLSSSMKRCPETVEKLAKYLKLEIKIDERFGSVERKRKVKEIIEKYGFVKDGSHEAAEKMEEEFAEDLVETFKNINDEYKGKTILISTHAEVVALSRKVLEGGATTQYFKNSLEPGDSFTMYLYEGKLLDLHRPVIDNLVLRGDKVSELKRVSETLDVWIESASMPYAQKHYPFENKEDVEANFPADYISEYIAQTRAWFYVMHVISTALMDSNSFKNCVVSGVIMGNDGRKMSKSFGNYPDPKGVLEEYGGDALRMYLLSTPLLKGENVDINENNIRGQLRDFSLPLWNTYSFFVTYANIHNWNGDPSNKLRIENGEWKMDKLSNLFDKWIVTRLHEFLKSVNEKLYAYDIPGATKELPEFLQDLSKWYIRRNRDRFRDGDKDALATLYSVLIEFAKTIAPFTPFLSEAIFQNLSGEKQLDTEAQDSRLNVDYVKSVHLELIGEADEKILKENSNLLEEMKLARAISGMGQSLRVTNSLRVRQPLSKIQISNAKFDSWVEEIIKDELNIKSIELTNKHSEGENYFSSEDTTLGIKITLDANLTPELKEEGIYRELVRNIQDYRKKKGLKMGEIIPMKIFSEDPEITKILENYKTFGEDVNAEVKIEENEGDEVKVVGKIVIIS